MVFQYNRGGITVNKCEMGKKSRAAGNRFEKRVREDLEKRGWIVDKWTNQIVFEEEDENERV